MQDALMDSLTRPIYHSQKKGLFLGRDVSKLPYGQKLGPFLGRDVSKLPYGQKKGPFLGRAGTS